MSETLEEKVQRVLTDKIEIAPYDSAWNEWFVMEKEHLRQCLPADLILRIEHIGSTAVPGLAAKPIVDMLIEITDEMRGRELIPKVLEPQGYDCFWRPKGSENKPPHYTWCIKRNSKGERTHHLHFVKPGEKEAELKFRDILRNEPETAEEYANLKLSLAKEHPDDRIAYTNAKGAFIQRVLGG